MAETALAQKYDLTNVITKYLDPHMILPILDFLGDKTIYTPEDLLKAKVKLISKTSLVDFAISLHQQIAQTDDVPEEMAVRRQSVLDQLQQLMEESKHILDLFQDQEVLKQLRQDKQYNLQFLKEKYDLHPEELDSLFKYAKLQFECGDYAGAAEMLYHFRILSTDQDKNLSALWGKLASEILVSNWETALEDFNSLKQQLDQRQTFAAPLEILQQRTWLIHWGLFIFFNHQKGRDFLLETFSQPVFKQTIQMTCPYILRYLTAAAILSKRRREPFKEIVTMISQESNQYRDPITEFLESLYIKFDFDGAQKTLVECEKVLEGDFFLEIYLDDFLQNARLFIFETYCKIHQRIDLGMLSEKLSMDRDEAEKWIVNLIRNTQLDAKIDSEKNAVNMAQKTQNIYQQVIERAKPVEFKTQVLSTNITKRNSQSSQPNKGQGQKGYPRKGGPRPQGGGRKEKA